MANTTSGRVWFGRPLFHSAERAYKPSDSIFERRRLIKEAHEYVVAIEA